MNNLNNKFSCLAAGLLCLSTMGQANASLIGSWDFNEGSGTVVGDSLGVHNGTLLGATWASNGVSGGAMSFDGNDKVEIMIDVPEFNFTIDFWAKTSSQNGGMFSVQTAGHDRHIGLQNGNPYSRVWPGGGWLSSPAGNYADDQWHHWALSVGTGVGQSLYLDGNLIGTHAYDHSNFNWQDRIWLGYSQDLGYYTGLLDEVAYHGTALSQTDIQSRMSAAALSVPEPTTLSIFALGFAGMMLRRSKKS